MTPLTKGRRRLIASDANSALQRVRVDNEESNIATVADMGTSEGGFRVASRSSPSCSGKVMDGNDELIEDRTSSHLPPSSPPC